MTYTTSMATYIKGVPILENTPSCGGGAVTSYRVSPDLPAGLDLNTTTGVLSGIPMALATTANYTVTAVNQSGSTTAILTITVQETETDLNVLLKETDGTEFRFSYFPSLNRLRLLVLSPPASMVRWEMQLSPHGQKNILAMGEGTLPFGKAGVTIQTPPLGDGIYEVRLSLIAADGMRRELLRTFSRKHFPWENNSLGQERVVIPPFTPLIAVENPPSVAVVLRQHELDGTGLWKQVASQGHDLLASPMRLEITSAGKTYVAAGTGLEFTEKAADRVAGRAAWTAGPIAGSTQFALDYDGMTKITLNVGSAGQQLDSLQLVIPMRTEETQLMHPVTDLLRFHYAGRIPNGKGVIWDMNGKLSEVYYTQSGEPDSNGKVWDSRHVGRWQLPGPFVPYLWMGGPERGIAWFAENDRDWETSADVPPLEIRRVVGSTSLLVRMVTKPIVLARPLTLVFGLMATPAKPMPESPVSHRRWWPGMPSGKTKDAVGIGFLGSCYYWGAAGPCYAFSPAFHNYSIYDEFSRLKKGGAVDATFTGKWLEQFTMPEFEAKLDTYRAHINWSQNFFSNAGWRPPIDSRQTSYAIPYTNGRAFPWGEEARTFLDEWSTLDIADPRWPGEERFLRIRDSSQRLIAWGKVTAPGEASGIAYATDPVSSWQDMVLYDHKRMLDTFADGIYFDDYFLAPSYSPFGPGYVDDKGNLHAGVNIFGFHDLTKRVAVMQHQMGRRPLVFLHMTNTNIVPMLSFGTILLDHEWRNTNDHYDQDFQDRLNLDDEPSLLLAQSTGLQSGCLGTIINLFHGDPHVLRSAMGVALTHEMRMGWGDGSMEKKIAELLCDFGYGLPDCRVWRYWDGSLPISTTGSAVKTLTMARPGRALVVVASSGSGGDVVLNLDLNALGLAENAIAVNAETGERLQRLDAGTFKFSLPRHDFLLVSVVP